MPVTTSIFKSHFDFHLRYLLCRSWLSGYDYRISDKVSIHVEDGRELFILMLWTSFFRGLRSKRIKRIEHSLAMNIKETHKKIFGGVSKDIGYLRQILNEVYFLKFKVNRRARASEGLVDRIIINSFGLDKSESSKTLLRDQTVHKLIFSAVSFLVLSKTCLARAGIFSYSPEFSLLGDSVLMKRILLCFFFFLPPRTVSLT